MTRSARSIAPRRICAQCGRSLTESSFAAHVARQHHGLLGYEMRQAQLDLIAQIRATPEGDEKEALRRHHIYPVGYEAWKEKHGL